MHEILHMRLNTKFMGIHAFGSYGSNTKYSLKLVLLEQILVLLEQIFIFQTIKAAVIRTRTSFKYLYSNGSLMRLNT